MNCDQNFIKVNCNNKNDYNCQRKCNIIKLKNVYNKTLNEYYNTYNYLFILPRFRRICPLIGVLRRVSNDALALEGLGE